MIARTEILHDELKRNYEYQKINAEKIQEIERSKLSKHIISAKKEVIDLIKKLRDKNVNGEDTRIIGKRLKEIETEHLTQKKFEKSISWIPQVGDFVKIKSLNSTGQIVDLDKKGGFYEVKCGAFRSTLSVSYTHLRAHETKANLVCRLLLEKKNSSNYKKTYRNYCK